MGGRAASYWHEPIATDPRCKRRAGIVGAQGKADTEPSCPMNSLAFPHVFLIARSLSL
jgi:hypothetical protein